LREDQAIGGEGEGFGWFVRREPIHAVEVVGRGTNVRVVTEVNRLRPRIGSKRERLDAADADRS